MQRKNAAALWAVVALTGVAAISWVVAPSQETRTVPEQAAPAARTSTEAQADEVRFESARVRRLLRASFSEWSVEDIAYAEAAGEQALSRRYIVNEWNNLGTEMYFKWYEHNQGLVTRDEQQAIAELIASKLPDEFATHVVSVEGWGGGLTITLQPAVQGIWWSLDCDVKRAMLDEFVHEWRTALHAAQEAKGREPGMVDVAIETTRGELAHWNAATGAIVYPLARCG